MASRLRLVHHRFRAHGDALAAAISAGAEHMHMPQRQGTGGGGVAHVGSVPDAARCVALRRAARGWSLLWALAAHAGLC